MKSVRVKKGDTLTKIAEQHHCTVEQLMRANGIPNKGVHLGVNMRVLIPDLHDILVEAATK